MTPLEKKFGKGVKWFRVIDNRYSIWKLGEKIKLSRDDYSSSPYFDSENYKNKACSIDRLEPWKKPWKPKRGELVEVSDFAGFPKHDTRLVTYIDNVSDIFPSATYPILTVLSDRDLSYYKYIRQIKKTKVKIGGKKLKLSSEHAKILLDKAEELASEHNS